MTDFLSGLALRNHPEKSLCQSLAFPVFLPVSFKIYTFIYSQRLFAANLAPHLHSCDLSEFDEAGPARAIGSVGRAWGDGVTVKAVWHIVKESAKSIGVAKLRSWRRKSGVRQKPQTLVHSKGGCMDIYGPPTHLLSVHVTNQRLLADRIFLAHAASLRQTSFFATWKIRGFLHSFFSCPVTRPGVVA
jgi:hypothetical protein